MNQKDVSKRDILDFEKFLTKVHDDKYKPFAPVNQEDRDDATGLSKIKREARYDFVGYADAVFGHNSKINVPGYRVDVGGKSGMADAGAFGTAFNTSESENMDSFIKKLSDF
jgi:hypothetical protein